MKIPQQNQAVIKERWVTLRKQQYSTFSLKPQGGIPLYGNYCGPGHGDPTGQTPPVDVVDAVCRTHDLCYAREGYWDCECDRQLVNNMPAAIRATSSWKGKAAGAAAYWFFYARIQLFCKPELVGNPLLT